MLAMYGRVAESLMENAMARRGALEAQVQQILDRLKVTPEQLFDQHRSVASNAAVAIDQFEPELFRPIKGGTSPLSWLWRINADTLDRKLRDELDPLNIGYCYMIRRRGAFVRGNSSLFAQLPPRNGDADDGSVSWAFDVPMNICSVSKFITAIATVKLLRDQNVRPKQKIGDYLPQYWAPSPEVRALTFHDLLRHESGLGGGYDGSGDGNFAAAKGAVRENSTGVGTFDYKNANFAILRVMFATLAGILPPGFTIPDVGISLSGLSLGADQLPNDFFWDVVSIQAYANYVNEAIFAPANIASRAFAPEGNAAKGYETEPRAPGVRLEDVAGDAGSSGWHLSIRELTRLANVFRRKGSILTNGQAQRMLVRRYGLDAIDETKAGAVYRKNGRFQNGTKGMDTAIYLMPDDLELAIFVNSLPRLPVAGPLRTAAVRPTHLQAIPRLIAESAELRFF